jgi:hypothetical protein
VSKAYKERVKQNNKPFRFYDELITVKSNLWSKAGVNTVAISACVSYSNMQLI